MTTAQSEISNFESRSKSVFDSLLKLESNHKIKESEYLTQSEANLERQESQILEEIESEFEFKVPSITSYKRQVTNSSNSIAKHLKKTPDHIANPDKWKKYSLEDVDSSQMSQSANYNAAMNFLNKSDKMKGDFQKLADKIEFNKPIGVNKMDMDKKCNSLETPRTILDKLNEEQEEIEESIEKMDLSETNKSEGLFKKKSKLKNIRSQGKSIEEDSGQCRKDESNNLDIELKEDSDDEFKDYRKEVDSSEENGFGEDFEKY
ncbi:unnamed protein product [Brachionus calyciflorus]|uniref:U5 small nuclear ribonucleoprotein TSSC4 n=1 Tax=Brachionus calyciflorus TaxID=104777 RepID=A0A813M3Y8_9BILA|nr:unnamed protein product [Brachionus calyciflorus]